ncbi:Metallo-dependent phosphatase-like protein [Dipodascopsis tothii]|uniref:Metallo-dependent phosphatase-like protein n=1 Tax=Dipodascopsis tothii TaxID=44089 RepID=UPI0034CDB34C
MRVLWAAVFWYGEGRATRAAVARCAWPRWERWPAGAAPARVLLVADPQLVDDHTYPGRPARLMRLTEFFVDRYMRRAWRAMAAGLPSDAVVFLGDLFDGGREWPHDQWLAEYRRFARVFPPAAVAGRTVVYSVAGNHDIGLGDTVVRPALDRFRAYYGEPSVAFDVGNHTLVALDTDSLMNTNDEGVYGPPRALLDQLAEQRALGDHRAARPRVLLTHIPLYRLPDTACGPKRESRSAIRIARGHQYQNVVDPGLSEEVLAKIQPVAVFSGDDHDACLVHHTFDGGAGAVSVPEYTVKSLSIAMGIQYPAFEMLSLHAPSPAGATLDPGTAQAHLCGLPSQFDLFRLYGQVAVLTVAAAVYAVWRRRRVHPHRQSSFGDKALLPPLPRTARPSAAARALAYVDVVAGRPGTFRRDVADQLAAIGWVASAVFAYYLATV